MLSGVKLGLSRFGRNCKAFSSVIATIFMVVIIWFIAINVFSYTIHKNTQFRDVENELDQIDVDRIREEITASEVNFTVDGDEVLVRAQVRNDGPVPTQIVTLWVVQAATEKYCYVSSLDIDLLPGATYNFTRLVEIQGLSPKYGFTAWFVTSRGNRVLVLEESEMVDFVKYSEETVVAELTMGIGYMGMDFGSFRYYEYVSPVELDDYPNGSASMDVPVKMYVAFAINMTNLDHEERNITIDAHSLWWGIYEKSAVPHNQWWYIVNVDSDGVISPTFTPILIPFNVTARLVFASATDVGISGFTQQATAKDECTLPVCLELHGWIGDEPYSQTLPFVALHFHKE